MHFSASKGVLSNGIQYTVPKSIRNAYKLKLQKTKGTFNYWCMHEEKTAQNNAKP